MKCGGCNANRLVIALAHLLCRPAPGLQLVSVLFSIGRQRWGDGWLIDSFCHALDSNHIIAALGIADRQRHMQVSARRSEKVALPNFCCWRSSSREPSFLGLC